MAYALVANGSGYIGGGTGGFSQIAIPSSTPFVIRFRFRVSQAGVEQPFVGLTSGTGSNFIIVSGSSSALIMRLSGASTVLTSSITIAADTEYECEIIRTGTSALSMRLNGVEVATGSSSLGMNFNSFMRRGAAYLTAGSRLYNFTVEVNGSTLCDFINLDDPADTLWDNQQDPTTGATLSGLATDGTQWFEFTPEGSGVSFNGPVPDQTLAAGDVSIAVGGYFSGATSYSSVGAALPAWATLNASTGEISGLATEGTTVGVIIRGSDGSTTADSNAFTVTIEPASALLPQGTTTITNITTSTNTVNITYSYDAADATGFEYSIDLGLAEPSLSNPETIMGLNQGQEYSIRYRAVNEHGAGNWSAAQTFTLATEVSLTTGVIKNEALTTLADTLFPTVDVYSQTTGASVARFTSVTSSPAGSITLTDAAFEVGTTYRLWYELPNGDWGTEKVVAA